MEAPLGFLPKARRQGIITKEVDGELLIYDLDRDKAHCLNPSAAAIWNLCDGRTTPEEIARQLGSTAAVRSQSRQWRSETMETDVVVSNEVERVDERIVWLAIVELSKRHLLESGGKELCPQAALGMSRREAVKWISLGAALPVVISITAPTARANVSNCGGNNAACTSPDDCCSSVCAPNTPPDPGMHCVGN